MNLLLDTPVFLWWLADSFRLSDELRRAIADGDALVFVSAVSLWEIAEHARAGLIDARDVNFAAEIAENGFEALPLQPRHIAALAALPADLTDPYDRLLAAQAATDGLRLLKGD